MSFHSTVLTIATIILILVLSYIGYVFGKLLRNRKYPPTISRCPDYYHIESNTNGTKTVEYCAKNEGLGEDYSPYYTVQKGFLDVKPIPGSETTWSTHKLMNLTELEKQKIVYEMKNNRSTWDGITY